MSDVHGGSRGKPGEVQFLNEAHTISCSLTEFDWNVLHSAIRNSRAGATPGMMPASGVLLAAGGFLKSLTITSPLGGRQRTYPNNVYLISPMRLPLGTVNSNIAVVFRAIVYVAGADSLDGGILYQGG